MHLYHYLWHWFSLFSKKRDFAKIQQFCTLIQVEFKDNLCIVLGCIFFHHVLLLCYKKCDILNSI